MSVTCFGILERQESGRLHLALTGELDIASVPALKARLSELSADKTAIRMDLSRLEFIDSAGLHLLIRAIDEAESNGWRLQIDRAVTSQVRRLFELVHLERVIPGYDSDRR